MNRIRELRKQMSMTQKELAKHLQVADSTLSYWEIGKYEPDNDALMRLSRFFQVPIDYILGGDFTKWDIRGSELSYPDVDTSYKTGSGKTVSESKVAYFISGKTEDYIEPKTIDKQLNASMESSVPESSQPTTPANTTDSSRNAQAALNRIEFEDLTQGELDLLAEFASFIKSRRK